MRCLFEIAWILSARIGSHFIKQKKQLSIGFKQLRGLQSDRKGDTLKKKVMRNTHLLVP